MKRKETKEEEYSLMCIAFESWKKWIRDLLVNPTYEKLRIHRKLFRKNFSQLNEEERKPFMEFAEKANKIK